MKKAVIKINAMLGDVTKIFFLLYKLRHCTLVCGSNEVVLELETTAFFSLERANKHEKKL